MMSSEGYGRLGKNQHKKQLVS